MFGFASNVFVGRGQYRNAVASGGSVCLQTDPTLLRYGTDPIQLSNYCLVNPFHLCRIVSLLESNPGDFARFDIEGKSNPTERYRPERRVV